MMKKDSVMHIGFDDTDSPKAMCTTFLAYKIVNYLKEESVEFLDYPHLIRFNPNIPWKTRGNGAVALSIKTNNPEKIKRKIKQLVKKYSDTKGGANPGLVFYEKNTIPSNFSEFSRLALWRLINRSKAKHFAVKNRIETLSLGNGQGLVGAIGAIGYKFQDHTFELISYRKKSHIGKKRIIDKESVKKMQEKTYPTTFNSFDHKKNRVIITPRGPDPVFYGLRGENIKSVLVASKMIQIDERLDGYMAFKTNQGTGDHLKNEIDIFELKPFTSGTIIGIVSKKPQVQRGGHVVFSISKMDKEVLCAVYEPTKITSITQQLIVGDKIRVGGGVRKATKNHQRVLNVEFLEILKLEKDMRLENPLCKKCNKKMKSKGKNQGFQCIKCGKKASEKIIHEIPRKLTKKLYLPAVSAHRHLTRPLQRMKRINQEEKFDPTILWCQQFRN
ncbi:tRNA(Ile2) 2-agmatinylcytidine synthetase TiaS [archaeon MnTg01]|nr:tRNA(Ile2) 2-agmatinylcytidine synthetase TiaS [archaeon MnTg01]